MLGALERDVLLDPRDLESGCAELFQLAGDLLPQRSGEIEVAMVGDAGSPEKKFGEFGDFPVELLSAAKAVATSSGATTDSGPA